MQRPLEHIQHIPHFHLIRLVESRLLSHYLGSASSPFLDLGCGDGEFARSLGLRRLYGIDIDDAALCRLHKDGYYTESLKAKASAIPYPDEFFGTVFSNCAIEHMDDLNKVLSEVRRVLTKGGDFVFTVPKPEFFDVVKKDKALFRAGLTTEEVIAEYNRIHHHVNIFSLVEWSSILSKAGFEVSSQSSYLPGSFGRFVARMDVLYSFEKPDTKNMIHNLEKQYNSAKGTFFRWRVKQYLKNPQGVHSGTHLIIKSYKL